MRYNRITQLMLAIITIIVYSFIVSTILVGRGGDFEYHIYWAQQAFENNGSLPPNPLYPILVIIISRLFPTSDAFIRAGYVVAVAFHLITSLALYRLYIRPVLGNLKNYKQVFVAILLVMSLLLSSAITLFTLPAQNLFWGYNVPIVYHNSNIILLRAFGLILFFRILMCWDDKGEGEASISVITITALITILSGLSRPHHLIILLPAIGLIILWKYWQKSYQDLKHLLLGIIIPASILILVQTLVQPYTQGDGNAGNIGIVPFALLTYIPNSAPLIPKYFLSIAFPIIVYIAYFKQTRIENSLNLAWLSFFVSNIFTYFFVELDKISHFNFIPTSQIAVFILYVVSMRFFLQRIYSNKKFILSRKDYLIVFTFTLHVVSGIVWYIAEASLSTEARWW